MVDVNRSSVVADGTTQRLFGTGGRVDSLRGVVFDDLVALVTQRLDVRHASVYLVGAPRPPDPSEDGALGGVSTAAALSPADATSPGTTGSPGGTVPPKNEVSVANARSADELSALVVAERSAVLITDEHRSARHGDRNGITLPDDLRFYLGVPLTTADGTVVGALCAWDTRSREPAPDDVRALEQFARHAVTIIDLHRVARELHGEREVLAATGYLLEMIVEGAELPVVLHALALAVEDAIAGARCSINLLDGSVLRDGASPHLPVETLRAIDGIEIGPEAGSCGTAAYTGQTVIVSDIATDPRWIRFRQLALPFGLRACWSVPITGPKGQVLGTFALYYEQTRVPQQDELVRLGRWVNLAEVAISRARDIIALRAAATLDALTGLVNRNEVMRRITAAVAQPGRRAGILFIDLDQFKFVNDTLGHAAGDRFLQIVAQRLTECADDGATVARFGGDEFVVLIPDCDGDPAVEALARSMIGALHRPMNISGRTLSLSASVGIALQHDDEPAGLLDLVGDADLAMYSAKRTGRNSIAVFTPQMRSEAADRLSLEADLNLALANAELDCFFQPTVDMGTGRILDIEALLRWNSPTRGRVPPSTFVPVAEDSGLIGAIGQFILDRACAQMAWWRSQSVDWLDVIMWVNVSPRELREPGFADSVERALGRNGLPPVNLGLEVTESTFIESGPTETSTPVRDALLQLRRRGVHVAMDDFGTGYSSLAQLEHLPVDVLKIHRQFTADITSGGARVGLVTAILTLADTLGLRTVVEGVETVRQRDVLLRLGCRSAQGWLWSRPLPAAGFNLSLHQFSRSEPDVGAVPAPRQSSAAHAVAVGGTGAERDQ